MNGTHRYLSNPPSQDEQASWGRRWHFISVKSSMKIAEPPIKNFRSNCKFLIKLPKKKYSYILREFAANFYCSTKSCFMKFDEFQQCPYWQTNRLLFWIILKLLIGKGFWESVQSPWIMQVDCACCHRHKLQWDALPSQRLAQQVSDDFFLL